MINAIVRPFRLRRAARSLSIGGAIVLDPAPPWHEPVVWVLGACTAVVVVVCGRVLGRLMTAADRARLAHHSTSGHVVAYLAVAVFMVAVLGIFMIVVAGLVFPDVRYHTRQVDPSAVNVGEWLYISEPDWPNRQVIGKRPERLVRVGDVTVSPDAVRLILSDGAAVACKPHQKLRVADIDPRDRWDLGL